MDRSKWLQQMQEMAEKLYDRFAPLYWVKYGLGVDETRQAFIQKTLDRVPPQSHLLSAGCGAGINDGFLLEAGHSVMGIDQSEGMLARARERFPAARYEQARLQEMDFQAAFDGATCIDAMEHVCPEDWPMILRNFQSALKPGGVLYFTVDRGGLFVKDAYERALALGLPVVYGEVADKVDESFAQVMAMRLTAVPGDLADSSVYHYHPPLDQVRSWLDEAGFDIDDEVMGKPYEQWDGYAHFLVRKREARCPALEY